MARKQPPVDPVDALASIPPVERDALIQAARTFERIRAEQDAMKAEAIVIASTKAEAARLEARAEAEAEAARRVVAIRASRLFARDGHRVLVIVPAGYGRYVGTMSLPWAEYVGLIA